jgi:hypothetical protein
MVMLAEVVHVTVYFASVVVSAVDPVPVHSAVPDELFIFTVAWGNIVPRLAVFFIHSTYVTVEPLGITPERFGSPDCVSNSLMIFEPVAAPFRFAVCKATLEASGLAVLSWSRPVVVDASLWRW